MRLSRVISVAGFVVQKSVKFGALPNISAAEQSLDCEDPTTMSDVTPEHAIVYQRGC